MPEYWTEDQEEPSEDWYAGYEFAWARVKDEVKQERARIRREQAQDLSDLRYLSTCIENKAIASRLMRCKLRLEEATRDD